MAVKKQLKDEVERYFTTYGTEVINLIVDRHNLANEKRSWFSIRFASQDPVQEKECTQKMEELDRLIYNIDGQLQDLGIDEKNRTTMLRNIKKAYPDTWMSGFTKENL